VTADPFMSGSITSDVLRNKTKSMPAYIAIKL
jgi:hypothetical protein